MGPATKHSTLLLVINIALLFVIGLLLIENLWFRLEPGFEGRKAVVSEEKFSMIRKKTTIYDENHREFVYGNDMPLIFIGGVPRSGTTLMRAMLDAHPMVRCGEETRIIPEILRIKSKKKKDADESRRLAEAGVTEDVMDSAISAFILEIIVRHSNPAPRLCNKDPLALESMEYLSSLFPNAKFVLMIRDGRATVNSIIKKNLSRMADYDFKNRTQCLEKWNSVISQMYHQCYTVGEERCFPMYYEQLVLHPEKWMKELLKFLDLPWNSSVLYHEMFIGNKISLSKFEFSTDQVIKPVNTDGLSKWVGQYPDDVVKAMAQIAPMLAQLGYDPYANPPEYGKADSYVLNKMAHYEVR